MFFYGKLRGNTMKYVVDSFQLFLSCDEALKNHFYENGLQPTVPVRGKDRATFPILYCDNTISTIKRTSHLRKYAFPAESSNASSSALKWKPKFNGIHIPSENFYIDISAVDDNIRITAEPKSQYHLEFQYKIDTNMQMWENWFAIYLPIPTVISILRNLGEKIDPSKLSLRFQHEKKQTTGKREDFYHQTLPVSHYHFTYESFPLAQRFLRKHGFKGDFYGIASDPNNTKHNSFMKVGYVHTKETDGDFNRNPQISIKLSQRHIVNHTKPRGVLTKSASPKNEIFVKRDLFVHHLSAALYTLYMEVKGHDNSCT